MIVLMIKALFQRKAILLEDETFFSDAANELHKAVTSFLNAQKGGGKINLILTDSHDRYFEFEVDVLQADPKGIIAFTVGVTELKLDEMLDRMSYLSKKHEHHEYFKPTPKL